MMRVVAGEAKGRVLRAPKGLRTRPPTAKLKEAVFDILGPRTEDVHVLDLFAGSGSFGIEALSRGAREVVFVDNSAQAADAIEKNLSMLRWEERAKVLCLESCLAITKLAEKGRRFDIVFSDPPYCLRVSTQILEMLSASGMLATEGVVVTRSRKDEQLPDVIAGFTSVVQKTYGESRVSFWVMEAKDQA